MNGNFIHEQVSLPAIIRYLKGEAEKINRLIEAMENLQSNNEEKEGSLPDHYLRPGMIGWRYPHDFFDDDKFPIKAMKFDEANCIYNACKYRKLDVRIRKQKDKTYLVTKHDRKP